MTSHPQGHPTIKASDYIIIDQKGQNIIVERQVTSNEYNQQQTTLNPIASPATEALEYILEDNKPNIHTNLELSNSNMDDNSLLLDLNELLRRDPSFSGIEDSKPISPPQFISSTASNVEAMNAANININNRQGQGRAIPGSRQTTIFPSATIVSGQGGNLTGSILQNRINLDIGGSIGSSVASSNEKTAFDHGSFGSASPSFFPSNPNSRSALMNMDTSGLISGLPLSPPQHNAIAENNIASNALSFNLINHIPSQNISHGPTLAQLNSPTENEIPTGLINSGTGIKMEINDIDVIDDLEIFLSNQSANVSLGMAQPDIKPNIQEITRQMTNPLSPHSHQIKQEPGLSGNIFSGNQRVIQATNVTPLTNMNFWQANTDEMIFGGSSIRHPSDSSVTTVGSNTTANSTITSLSSSVPVNIFHNVSSPLSDILTDLSPTPQPNSPISIGGVSPSLRSTISPNGFIIGSTIANTLLSPNTQTPSNAGPTRNSTLHKLLMQRKGDGPITGRPSPVRSPEARKTLEQMRNSLSTSNPLISQQLLSRSAPTGNNPLGSGNTTTDTRVWTRREPRQHISSVCSVGETSSIADEVNDVLSGLSPNDDLQEIPSDDEDDLTGNYPEYKDTSDGK